MTDKRIIQDPRIAIAIAKALQGHEGNVTINLNMNASITDSGEETLKSVDLDLFNFVEALPQPRLRTLISMVYHLAHSRFKTNGKAAEFLGVNQRTIQRTQIALKGMEVVE